MRSRRAHLVHVGHRAPGGLRVVAGCALLAAACSGADARRPPAGPAPAAAARQASLPYESPARWEAHPSPLSYVTATMRLADGSCLVTEHSGQRWLTWPGRTSDPAVPEEDPGDLEPQVEADESYSAYAPNSCSGEGRAALDRAPETIVGIVRWPGSYGFIGESGTIHEAKTPLGRFTRRIAPPEPLRRVRGAGRTLLAVTETGRLLRWDEERGYERVDLGGALAFDLAVSPSGRAVVLAAPEAIFTSDDGGRRFTRAAAPSIGVQRVVHQPGGPFLIEGVTTTLAWDPREPASFQSTPERIGDPVHDVAISAGRSASASLVTQRRAAIDGDRYWEAGVGPVGEWALWKGKLDGRLSAASLNVGGPDDSNVIVAASGPHVAIAIIGWSDGDGVTLRVRASRDGGATFGDETPLVPSSVGRLGLAISREGRVLLTGACHAAEADSGESCPGGPLVLRSTPAEARPRVPSGLGPALAPAFSPDGRHAYFLTEGEYDRTVALFVSHDGGASFEERPLRVEVDGDERTFEAANETSITVSESGTLGVLLEDAGRSSEQVWVTTDADGRAVRAGELPIEDAVAGGFGERVLAISRAPKAEDGAVPVWESLDGGATWAERPGPVLLTAGYRRRGDVACGLAGCLIGDEVTRVGWGGDAAGPLPFEPPKPGEPPGGLRTPIVCEPQPGSTWTHVGGAQVLPDASEAARGRAAWTISTFDPKTGAAGVVAAMLPPSLDGEARVTTRQLLPPVAKGARWAFVRRPQIEGDALARVTLDPASAKAGRSWWKGRRIRNLEIAWENLEEGTSSRAVLPDAGVFDAGSIQELSSGQLALFMDVLSVSPKGIFVRATPREKATFFVDTAGKARSFELPGWPESVTEGAHVDTGDAVNVDGTFVMTSMFGGRIDPSPQTLLLARPPAATSNRDEPWTPWAATLAPPSDDGRLFTHVEWTYQGGYLAVWAQHAVPEAGHAASWISRILANGTLTAPSRLPTPYDLPSTPRACTVAEHRDLPRVRARNVIYGRTAFPGTRHPVLIDDGALLPPDDEPEGGGRSAKPASRGPAPIGRVAMLSEGVILRGTPSSPCVDAYAARGTSGAAVTAIVLGDLRQGWFFRLATAAKAPSAGGIDVRPLRCRFDPSAVVPAAVLEESAAR